jgi:hypothetical protein
MSVKDFKASQIRTSKIVVSGSESNKPALLIYSASSATDFAGGIQRTGANAMLKDVGTDVFMFVSGSKSDKHAAGKGLVRENITLFGGDIVISGTMFAENFVAEVDMTTTGSVQISGSLFLSGGLNVAGSENLGAKGHGARGVAIKIQRGGGSGADPQGGIVWDADDGTADAEIYESGGDLVISASNALTLQTGVGSGDYAESYSNSGIYLSSSIVRVGSYPSLGKDPGRAIGNDTVFQVTGAVGSAGTSLRGASVFQGDLVVSGGLDVYGSVTGVDTPVLTVNEATDRVGIGIAAPSTELHVAGDITVTDDLVFNSDAAKISFGEHGEVTLLHVHDTGLLLSDDSGVGITKLMFGDTATFIQQKADGELGIDADSVVNLNGPTIDINASSEFDLDGGAIKIDGTTVSLDGTDTTNLTMTANAAADKTLTVQAKNTGAGAGILNLSGSAVTIGAANGLGSVTVSAASVDIDEYIKHTGDTHTSIRFEPDVVTIAAGGVNYVKADATETGLIINPDGGSQNTTIKSNNKDAIVVAGATDAVYIHSGGAGKSPDESDAVDMNFFVSGSIGSRGTVVKGTSLFGGDVYVSGSTHIENSLYIENPTSEHRSTISVDATGDFTLTTDGASDNADITLDAEGKVILDSGYYGLVSFQRSGDDYLAVHKGEQSVFNTPRDTVVFELLNDSTDFTFAQFDNKELLRMTDTSQVLFLSGGASRSPNEASAVDTNFFVSGTIGSRATATRGTAVFGGDLVVSGSVYSLSEDSIYIGTGTKQVKISAAETAGSMNVGDGGTQVLILSGGAAKSFNEASAVDTNFFVSGTIGSARTAVRGTAVFGGDVVISGSLTDSSGLPIAGSGGGTSGSFRELRQGSTTYLVQTGSATFAGTKGFNYKASDVGGDVGFFVSGAAGSIGLTTLPGTSITKGGVSVFSGDTVISGAISGGELEPLMIGQYRTNLGTDVTTLFVANNGGSGAALFDGNLYSSGTVSALGGLTGSLTRLTDGRTYLMGGTNITVASSSSGQITISDSNEKFTRNTASTRVYLSNDGDRVNIGGGNTNPASTMKMELNIDDSENLGGLIIDSNDTGSTNALILDHEGTSDALRIFGKKGLYINQDLTNGYGAYITRDIAESGNEPLVNIFDNNTSNQQASLQVRQDGTGDIVRLRDGADIIHRFMDGGVVKLGGNDTIGSDVRLFVSGTDSETGTGTNKRTTGVALFSGDTVVSGGLYVKGGIYREGDHDTVITPSTDSWLITAGGTDLIKADKTENTISLNPDQGAISTIIQGPNKMGLAVDGAANRVLILSGGSGKSYNEAAAADVAFYVSGAVGSRGTAVRGTAVFGGDVATSGSLRIRTGESPTENISDKGDDLIVESSGNTGISIAAGAIHQAGIYFPDASDDDIGAITYDHGGNGLTLRANGGDHFHINRHGNIGIGNSAPTVKLDVTGIISASLGYSGSLTRLSDGRSYLAAGSGVTITSASNGQVVIAAAGGGGGSITTVSGSTSVSSVTSIDFTKFGLLQNLGGNKVAITGTIGQAEEGTYTDGLFTTFNPETPIGTAIDKINEVLYYLAPTPAANITQVGTDGRGGVTALLSLGSSTGLPSPNTYSYSLVAASAGLGAAVDVNSSYTVVTSSNNIRMGVIGPSAVVIKGQLAHNISANTYSNGVVNHSGSVFGDADQGTLGLYVNGSLIKSINLATDIGTGNPGSGADTQVDGNSSGFIELSVTASAVQSNGQTFGIFQNRSGKYQVGTATQRAGWNYARVVHTIGSTTYTTNYSEWFNATNGVNPNANDVRIESVNLSGSKHISGICYATGAEGKYISRIDNFYDFVYATNTISFTTTNTSISSQTVPSPGSATNAHLAEIDLTGSFQVAEASINAGTMSSGSITANFSVSHPVKTDMSNTGSITSSAFLLYSASQLATNQFEDFVYEDHRLKSGSYTSQASSIAAGNVWNSELSLTSSNAQYAGQADGLAFFAGKLKAPRQLTDNNGNFRIFDAGHALTGSGIYQPDYSGVTSGIRTFYRAFRNQTGAVCRDFDFYLSGTSTTVVPTSTALNSGRIRVYAKLPGTTDFLDLAQPFVYASGAHNDGAYIGSFNNSLSSDNAVTNHISFGTGSISSNDYVVIKVEADATWTGHLAGMNVRFPAVASDAVSAAPDVNELQIDTITGGSAVNGRLAFGANNSISGYINVTGSTASRGMGTNVDVNGGYSSSTNNNQNKRYGIIGTSGGIKTISGDINGDTNVSGNSFTADSFRRGHEGTLKLYVNQSGSAVHSVDLAGLTAAGNAGSGTGTSLNSNGSGFQAVSVVTPGKDGSGLPDYRYHYRTGEFVVVAADQNANGWNWAKVVHEVSGQTDKETTYIEWINDSDSNAVAIAGAASGTFGAAGYYTQSGVKYFNTGLATVATGTVMYRATDVYSNIYSSDGQAVRLSTLTNVTCQNFQITGSEIVNTFSSSLSSNGMALPLLNNGGNPRTAIHITGTITYTGGVSLPADASPLSSMTNVDPVATLTVKHPIDSNATSTITINNFLAYSGSAGSSNVNTREQFRSEHFRLQSGSFATQGATGSLDWNTSKSLLSSDTGHQTGLLLYGLASNQGYLISPKNSKLPQGGNFTNSANLTTPPENVNYTTCSGERSFYRAFKNNTTSDQAVVTLVVKGSATLVPRSGAGADTLGTNDNVHIFVRIPGKTEWLDIAKAAAGGLSDGDGALSGDRDPTIDSGGASNEITFSSAFVGGDPASDGSGEHFILRIQADSNWTGYITDLALTW